MDYYKKLVEELSSSDVYMALVTKNFLKSDKCATELGLAVLLDKPILLAVQEGTELPRNIKRLAQDIEYFKGPDDIKLTTKRLLKKHSIDS